MRDIGRAEQETLPIFGVGTFVVQFVIWSGCFSLSHFIFAGSFRLEEEGWIAAILIAAIQGLRWTRLLGFALNHLLRRIGFPASVTGGDGDGRLDEKEPKC